MKKMILILLPFVCLLTMAVSDAPPESDGRVNKYVTRSELLMESMGSVGVTEPKSAASVWVKGLMARSAAMQYSVMSKRLRTVYAAQLDALDSNWVTGVSSPWVRDFTIRNVNGRSDHVELCVTVETMTSTGPDDTICARLTVIREDGFWRIDGIRADEGLYPYTLYRPPG